jgi:hypothetical protein
MQIYHATAVEKVLQFQQHFWRGWGEGDLSFKSIVEQFWEVRTGAKDKSLQDFFPLCITAKGSIA